MKMENSINRNIVECKVNLPSVEVLFGISINRNIVECKVKIQKDILFRELEY